MNIKFILYGKYLEYFTHFQHLNEEKLKNTARVFYSHEVRKKDFVNFEKNITYIISQKNIISPNLFFHTLENKLSLPENSVMLTFDDGLMSSYEFTQKILKKYNIKAIFFIPTAIFNLKTNVQMKTFVANKIFFGQKKPSKLNEDDYRLMTINEIKEYGLSQFLLDNAVFSYAIPSPEIFNYTTFKKNVKSPILGRL